MYEQIKHFVNSKPKSYFKVLIWVFLILFSGKFIIKNALPYFGFEQETFGHYWDYKWALVGFIELTIVNFAWFFDIYFRSPALIVIWSFRN
jgi:hypothetical protein